jgi:hypothetical protein
MLSLQYLIWELLSLFQTTFSLLFSSFIGPKNLILTDQSDNYDFLAIFNTVKKVMQKKV